RTWRYWQPAAMFGQFRGGAAEAHERFRLCFQEAVRRTLATRTGILLSGGLDSSSVALVASRLRPSTPISSHEGASRPPASPSLFLLGAEYSSIPQLDESRYAVAAAEAAGLPLHRVDGRVDRWDPRSEDNPLGVPGLVVPTGVLDTALPALARLGCDVVLDGHDGDGVLGLPFAVHANTLIDLRVGPLMGCVQQAGWTPVLRTLARDFLPPTVRMARRRARGGPSQDAERLVTFFRGRTRARILAEFGWRSPRSGWRRQQLRSVLPPLIQGMEELEMHGATHGVDLRHPFADRDLIEFLLSLPHRLKGSPHRTKEVLRHGLCDILPTVVRERGDKIDFCPLLDRRVDYSVCLTAIQESGIRLPDVDYDLLFSAGPDLAVERFPWIRLARAHVFVAGGPR
ncbi:MAG TPA: asparagine synthase C-terminal domain-containing protein, partial [Chloroflexota bacterium]